MRKLYIPVLIAALACASAQPGAADPYAGTDVLFETLAANVAAAPSLNAVVEIDHARLAAEVGSDMPPARVLLFSDPEVETALIVANPLAALDLPLRVLAYEADGDAGTKVVYNRFAYLAARYELDPASPAAAGYAAAMQAAVAGIPAADIQHFASDAIAPDGIVTLTSPFGYAETLVKLRAAIDLQQDTVWFGEVGFAAQAERLGVELAPARLLLFGGPGPGGKAMGPAPTLGLDAFCQKLLVWEDSAGGVRVSFNDLLAIADRQDVRKTIALRVVNRRVLKTFETALEPEPQ